MFQEWYNSFKSCAFSRIDSIYVFSYEPKTVPRRLISKFPQNMMMADYALLVRAPVEHPNGFVQNFEYEFRQLPCSATRRSMILNNIPFFNTKLTCENNLMPGSLTEKKINLIAELIDLCFPMGGAILDPFAGPFSRPIGCSDTMRRCVAVESDTRKYQMAFKIKRNTHNGRFIRKETLLIPPELHEAYDLEFKTI